MITKARVTKIIDVNRVMINIPLFANSISYNDKIEQEAIINTPPNIKYLLKEGDIVFIDFEENRADSPVILGMLSTTNDSSNTAIVADSIEITKETHLSGKTYIGEVNAEQIQYLKSLESNAQDQINALNKKSEYILNISVQGNSLVLNSLS